MRRRVGSIGASKRKGGAVRDYLQGSPELEQTVAMLGGRRCRRCGACGGEWKVLGGEEDAGEQARVVEGARDDGGWLELSPEDVGGSGGLSGNQDSLGALEVWRLGGNGKGRETFNRAWSWGRFTEPLIMNSLAKSTQKMFGTNWSWGGR